MKYLIIRNDDVDYFSNVLFLKTLENNIYPFKQTYGIIPFTVLDTIYDFKEVEATDIYVIIYLFIYSVMCQNNIFGIHSIVMMKKNKAVIFLGDFGMGKTTLSIELQKQGWQVLSADQSFVCFDKGRLIYQGGSNLVSYNGNTMLVQNDRIGNVTLEDVVVIRGLAQGGRASIRKFTNKFHAYKHLWKYMVWPWNTFIFSEYGQCDYMKNIYCQKLAEQLSKIRTINFWEIRGDPIEISSILEMEMQLESSKQVSD